MYHSKFRKFPISSKIKSKFKAERVESSRGRKVLKELRVRESTQDEEVNLIKIKVLEL